MSLTPAKVQKRPSLVCIGKIKEYGAVEKPKEGKFFHHIPIEIEPAYSGMGTTFRLIFWPEFLSYNSENASPDLRMAKGENAENDERRSRYYVFAGNIAHEDGTAHLQVLLGERFEEFGDALSEAEEDGAVDPETFRRLMMKFLPEGTQIGYVLKQSKSTTEDGEKKLEDRYELGYFFPSTQDGLKTMLQRVKRSKKRANPLELTFSIDDE